MLYVTFDLKSIYISSVFAIWALSIKQENKVSYNILIIKSSQWYETSQTDTFELTELTLNLLTENKTPLKNFLETTTECFYNVVNSLKKTLIIKKGFHLTN